MTSRLRLWRSTALCLVLASACACSRDPVKRSRKYIASGDEYAEQGKYKQAAIEYRNAVKATPELAEPHTKLADVSLHTKDIDTASVEYSRAAELSPENASAQVRAASVFLLTGHADEAKDRAEIALRLAPRDADAHLALGEALAALHDRSE